MRQPNPRHASPTPLAGSSPTLPAPVLELCARLESTGIPTLFHGDALLAELRTPRVLPSADGPGPARPDPARALVCAADADSLLRALPGATVTASRVGRLTQATEAGPVDVLPIGDGGEAALHAGLRRFGIGPLAFGWRPADARWWDPADQRRAFVAGRLELVAEREDASVSRAIFEVAPRRIWIVARLLSEFALEASGETLDAASKAVPEIGERLPEGAPARRALERILMSERPELGLGFLRGSGASARIAPGTRPEAEQRIADLPPLPAIRWAAWLRGSATTSALVRLRMPHALARRVERVQATHPLDRSVADAREIGVRRLLQRLTAEEIDALFAWRERELAEHPEEGEAAQLARQRLARISDRIDAIRAAASRSGRVRALALDGRAVMAILGEGPGPHVGRALAHLARHVETRPEANEPTALEAELLRWQAGGEEAGA